MSYIAMEIFKVFLLTFITFEVIYGAIVAIQVIRDYGMGLVMIIPILKSTFAYELYFAIPVGLLFATSLVFGRMVADREIAAFRSLGFSNLELAATPVLLGLVLSVVCFFVNGWSVPEARKIKSNADQFILDQLQYLGEGWNKKIPLGKRSNNTLLIKNYNGTQLNDIFVFIEDPEKLDWKGFGQVSSLSFPFVLHARQGEVLAEENDVGVSLELRDVRIFVDQGFIDKSADDEPHGNFMNRFHMARYRLGIQTGSRKGKGKVKEYTNPELAELAREKQIELELAESPPVDQAAAEGAATWVRKCSTEFHRRLTFSLACLAFAIMAVMVALTLNSTNRFTPFFVSVVSCCLVFFVLSALMWLRLEKRWPMYWPRKRAVRRASSEGGTA